MDGLWWRNMLLDTCKPHWAGVMSLAAEAAASSHMLDDAFEGVIKPINSTLTNHLWLFGSVAVGLSGAQVQCKYDIYRPLNSDGTWMTGHWTWTGTGTDRQPAGQFSLCSGLVAVAVGVAVWSSRWPIRFLEMCRIIYALFYKTSGCQCNSRSTSASVNSTVVVLISVVSLWHNLTNLPLLSLSLSLSLTICVSVAGGVQ